MFSVLINLYIRKKTLLIKTKQLQEAEGELCAKSITITISVPYLFILLKNLNVINNILTWNG